MITLEQTGESRKGGPTSVEIAVGGMTLIFHGPGIMGRFHGQTCLTAPGVHRKSMADKRRQQ